MGGGLEPSNAGRARAEEGSPNPFRFSLSSGPPGHGGLGAVVDSVPPCVEALLEEAKERAFRDVSRPDQGGCQDPGVSGPRAGPTGLIFLDQWLRPGSPWSSRPG
jgi:hypothetical protein